LWQIAHLVGGVRILTKVRIKSCVIRRHGRNVRKILYRLDGIAFLLHKFGDAMQYKL
jgi:hypothetical protein